MDREYKSEIKPTISIIGIPFDDNSSFMFGTAQAPSIIYEGLNSPSTNLCAENGLDLNECPNWNILPDMRLETVDREFSDIQANIISLLKDNTHVISIGGDHSITYPIVSAHNKFHENLNILHLDAHTDLYDSLNGNRYSHASVFSRIMEKKLAKRLVQVGIRTITPCQREQIERFGVEVYCASDGIPTDLSFDGPVYLSIDLDCLDPAFAPGVSHYEPGGLSTREVINIIHNFKGNLIGADIVEFNPKRDSSGITQMVAAKLLKEITARILNTSVVETANINNLTRY